MTAHSQHPSLSFSASRLQDAVASRRLQDALRIAPEYGAALRQAVYRNDSAGKEAEILLDEAVDLLVRLRQTVEAIKSHDMCSEERVNAALRYARSAAIRAA